MGLNTRILFKFDGLSPAVINDAYCGRGTL